MALPAGVTFATVTLSPPLGAGGVVGELRDVRLRCDRRLVWSATGQTLYDTAEAHVPATPTGSVAMQVPHVDQSGFVDRSGGAITGWSYTLTYSVWMPAATQGSNVVGGTLSKPLTKRFQVTVGQSAVSADKIPDGTATVPVVVADTAPADTGVRDISAELASDLPIHAHRVNLGAGGLVTLWFDPERTYNVTTTALVGLPEMFCPRGVQQVDLYGEGDQYLVAILNDGSIYYSADSGSGFYGAGSVTYWTDAEWDGETLPGEEAPPPTGGNHHGPG